MRYKVTYERKTTASSYYLYSSEIIEVKGIVHAHKRAKDHLYEIRKLSEFNIRIDKIMLIEEEAC